MLNRNFPSFPTLPQPPPRGPMPPIVSVIIPLARTNLITNPSFETNTTGWSGAFFGTIARSTTKQYHGVYSLAVTPTAAATDGANYDIALTAGTTYAISCKLFGVFGVPYRIALYTGGPLVSSKTYIGTGRWQWLSLIHTATVSATHSIVIGKASGTNTTIFYIDGAQCEAITDGILQPTTYIDGDQPGVLIGQQPPAYGWNGTPHASTSYRTAITRAGGYLVNLSLYNFLLTGIVGLGMAAPNNVSVPYTLLDGARYLRTQKPPRTFSLAGRWQADDIFSLRMAQSDMRQVLDRDYAAVQQPLVLMIEPQDECDNVIGDFAQIQCLYAGGLEGNDGNIPIEDAAPTFTMYLPFLIGGSGGAALTVQQSVSNANYILQRSSGGVWSALGTGGAGGPPGVFATIRAIDGTIYAGGYFTSMGGVANTNEIAKWNGTAWSALGTGAHGGVLQGFALTLDPSGNLYAAGAFGDMGGVANTANLAKWNGTAWSSITPTVANSYINAAIFAPDGNLYVAGNFTAIDGVAANRVAKWDGTTWTALSTGLATLALALAWGPDGNLYAGGNNYVKKWNGTAWSDVNTAPDAGVSALAFDAAGNLYAGGGFSAIGGTTIYRLAKWNGTQWTALGGGLANAGVVREIAYDPVSNSIYVAGDFGIAPVGLFTPLEGFLRWTGTAWLIPDIDLPATGAVRTVSVAQDGTMTIGFDASGSATAAALTTVTNATPSVVYPTLTIKGPSSGTSRIYQIVNYTTGIGIWLNYVINTGETATFVFDPTHPSYTSDFQGDLSGKVLSGSLPSLFYLAQGANTISFFAAAASVSAVVSWQNHYNGVADLVN